MRKIQDSYSALDSLVFLKGIPIMFGDLPGVMEAKGCALSGFNFVEWRAERHRDILTTEDRENTKIFGGFSVLSVVSPCQPAC
jgi:hypothetical protein